MKCKIKFCKQLYRWENVFRLIRQFLSKWNLISSLTHFEVDSKDGTVQPTFKSAREMKIWLLIGLGEQPWEKFEKPTICLTIWVKMLKIRTVL